jgi:putative FmdB family regulatory protein
MPIYEYRCAACGHHLEALQKMSEAPLRKCPDCGKSQLRRLVSAPQFRLKGSGWYETDFKGDKETKRNLSGRDSHESESKSDTASETAVKDEAKKEVAAAKADGGADKAAKPKPTAVKSAAHGKKRAVKARGRKSARG